MLPKLSMLAICLVVVAVDLGAKQIADGTLSDFGSTGLFRGFGSSVIPIILTVLLLLAFALAALVAFPRVGRQWPLVAVSVGLILGGGLATFIEYASRGKVEDFIRIGPLLTNIADLAMIVGVVMVVVLLIYKLTTFRRL